MTLSDTRRFQMAQPVTGRPETVRRYPRHPSAPSGTIRYCAASHDTDRTNADGAKSQRRRRRPRIPQMHTAIVGSRLVISEY